MNRNRTDSKNGKSIHTQGNLSKRKGKGKVKVKACELCLFGMRRGNVSGRVKF